jgi:hypothetical protein
MIDGLLQLVTIEVSPGMDSVENMKMDTYVLDKVTV